MVNEIAKAQEFNRLNEINNFYKKYSPDYKKLKSGIVHNDLNLNNIFILGEKYFFIDFEHLKYSPLISDIGVLVLELWDYSLGKEDYQAKLYRILKGYEKNTKLTEYDKENIIIFSLRYLYSDENWYNYWSLNGNPDAANLIPEVRLKQNLLLHLV